MLPGLEEAPTPIKCEKAESAATGQQPQHVAAAVSSAPEPEQEQSQWMRQIAAQPLQQIAKQLTPQPPQQIAKQLTPQPPQQIAKQLTPQVQPPQNLAASSSMPEPEHKPPQQIAMQPPVMRAASFAMLESEQQPPQQPQNLPGESSAMPPVDDQTLAEQLENACELCQPANEEMEAEEEEENEEEDAEEEEEEMDCGIPLTQADLMLENPAPAQAQIIESTFFSSDFSVLGKNMLVRRLDKRLLQLWNWPLLI